MFQKFRLYPAQIMSVVSVFAMALTCLYNPITFIPTISFSYVVTPGSSLRR